MTGASEGVGRGYALEVITSIHAISYTNILNTAGQAGYECGDHEPF